MSGKSKELQPDRKIFHLETGTITVLKPKIENRGGQWIHVRGETATGHPVEFTTEKNRYPLLKTLSLYTYKPPV